MERTAILHRLGAFFIRLIKRTVTVVAWLFLLGFVFAGFFEFASRHECARLPNGLHIGLASVSSPRVGADANIALKRPDGHVLIDRDRAISFYDHEVVAGTAPNTPEGKHDLYIYVNGIGLIKRSEKPVLYHYHWNRKVKELGIEGRNSSSNMYRIWLLLWEDKDNIVDWCKTNWF